MIRGLVMGRNEQKPFTPCALLDFGRIRQIWWDVWWEFPPFTSQWMRKMTQKAETRREKQHSVALNGRPQWRTRYLSHQERIEMCSESRPSVRPLVILSISAAPPPSNTRAWRGWNVKVACISSTRAHPVTDREKIYYNQVQRQHQVHLRLEHPGRVVIKGTLTEKRSRRDMEHDGTWRWNGNIVRWLKGFVSTLPSDNECVSAPNVKLVLQQTLDQEDQTFRKRSI